jgi:hypothetical protein
MPIENYKKISVADLNNILIKLGLRKDTSASPNSGGTKAKKLEIIYKTSEGKKLLTERLKAGRGQTKKAFELEKTKVRAKGGRKKVVEAPPPKKLVALTKQAKGSTTPRGLKIVRPRTPPRTPRHRGKISEGVPYKKKK